MSRQPWNWVSDGVLPAAVVILRACWLWPWLQMLHRWLAPSQSGPLLSLAWIIGLQAGGIAAARLTLARRAPDAKDSLARERLAVAILGVLCLLLALWWNLQRASYPLGDLRWLGGLAISLTHWGDEIPAAFIALLVGAYLWLRGVMDGARPLLYDDVWGTFAAAFVALLLLLLLGRVAGDGIPAGIEGSVLALFAVGMMALALASLDLARGIGRQRGQSPLQINRYWLVSVVAVVAGLLILGILLSLIFAPEVVARAMSWTAWLLRAIGWILYAVFLVVVYLVFLVLEPLIYWLRGQLAATPERPPLQLPNFQGQFEEITPGTPVTLPAAYAEALRWGGLALLILAIGVAFALALRRLLPPPEEEVEETRELILSRQLLEEQLAQLWQGWLRRLRRRSARMLGPFLPLEGEASGRQVIRAIYQALLAAAQARGHPRPRQRTPSEYRHDLASTWPEAGPALDILTDGYMQARYGEDPPEASQIEQVRQAWEQARTILEDQDGPSAE